MMTQSSSVRRRCTKTRSRYRRIRMLETNRIYLGDCVDLLKEIDDESCDLVVADPPYLTNYKTNHRKDKSHRFNRPIENDKNTHGLIQLFAMEMYRVLKPDTALYCFCNWKHIDFFKRTIEEHFKVKNIITWVKNNWT